MTTPELITRQNLRDVLAAWRGGGIASEELHGWAEARYSSSDFEPADDVVSDILGELDMLNVNLVLPQDAGVFLEMLDTPEDEPERAADLLRIHAEGVDLGERMKRLADDPFYSRFIGG